MVIQGIESFMSKLVVIHLLLLLRHACAALFATDTSASLLPTTTQSSQTMIPHFSNFRNGAYYGKPDHHALLAGPPRLIGKERRISKLNTYGNGSSGLRTPPKE
jgi:hypothetical protein